MSCMIGAWIGALIGVCIVVWILIVSIYKRDKQWFWGVDKQLPNTATSAVSIWYVNNW